MLSLRNNITLCRLCIPNRRFSGSNVNLLDQRYRKSRKLPMNPNAAGVLTDSPDYSYLDGRLTPLTQGQKRRVIGQEEIKHQVIALSKEIDFAVERYKQMEKEKEEARNRILAKKLKPKGVALVEPK